jgi:hypothetical protein
VASRNLGGDSAILNWHDKITSRQRAEIAKNEAEFSGWLTSIRQHEADLGYVELSAENREVVTKLATDQGMTIEGYALHLQKLDDARFSAVSQLLTRELDRIYGAMTGAQTLAYKRAEADIEVAKTRQLNAAEVEKDQQKEHVKLVGEADSTAQTIEAAGRYMDAPLLQEDKLLERAGRLRQQIEDTLAMEGKSDEWRQGQADLLRKALAKIEAQVEGS